MADWLRDLVAVAWWDEDADQDVGAFAVRGAEAVLLMLWWFGPASGAVLAEWPDSVRVTRWDGGVGGCWVVDDAVAAGRYVRTGCRYGGCESAL